MARPVARQKGNLPRVRTGLHAKVGVGADGGISHCRWACRWRQAARDFAPGTPRGHRRSLAPPAPLRHSTDCGAPRGGTHWHSWGAMKGDDSPAPPPYAARSARNKRRARRPRNADILRAARARVCAPFHARARQVAWGDPGLPPFRASARDARACTSGGVVKLGLSKKVGRALHPLHAQRGFLWTRL